ncbi:MAG: hypothetical protein ACKVQB_03495, partial [Bacteroidia bacterium]
IWEAKIGFKSQRRIFNEIVEAEYEYLLKPYENLSEAELLNVTEPKGHSDLYNLYLNKLIKVETGDATNPGTYNYIVDAPYYSSVINENGFLAIGNSIFQIKANLIKEISGKQYDKLKILDTTTKDDTYNKIKVSDITTMAPRSTMSTCNFPLTSQWQQNGNRRGMTTVYFTRSFINPYPYSRVQVQYSVNVRAQKRNNWGNWLYVSGDCYISGTWTFNMRKIYKANLGYAGTDTYTKSYTYPYHPNSINNFTTFLSPYTGSSTGSPTSYIYSFPSSSPYAFSDAYLSNVLWNVSVPGGSNGINCNVQCN